MGASGEERGLRGLPYRTSSRLRGFVMPSRSLSSKTLLFVCILYVLMCRMPTGNGEKLNSSCAEPDQAINSDVAYFPSISCVASCTRARYTLWIKRIELRKRNRGRNGLHQQGEPVVPSILFLVFNPPYPQGTVGPQILLVFIEPHTHFFGRHIWKHPMECRPVSQSTSVASIAEGGRVGQEAEAKGGRAVEAMEAIFHPRGEERLD